MSANLAADELSGGPLAEGVGGRLWDRLVGANYAAFRDALEPIPSAKEAIDAGKLDPLVFTVGDVLDEWLVDVGFRVEDRLEGLYVDVLSHDYDP